MSQPSKTLAPLLEAEAEDLPALKHQGDLSKIRALQLLEDYLLLPVKTETAIWILHNFKFDGAEASRIVRGVYSRDAQRVSPLAQLEVIAAAAETLYLTRADYKLLLISLVDTAEEVLEPINRKAPGLDLNRVSTDEAAHPLFVRYRQRAMSPDFGLKRIEEIEAAPEDMRDRDDRRTLKELKSGPALVELSASDFSTYDRILALAGWFLDNYDRQFGRKDLETPGSMLDHQIDENGDRESILRLDLLALLDSYRSRRGGPR